MRLRTDGMFAIGIKDNEIRVTTHRNRPLAWVQPKQLCRSGCDQLDKTVRAESAARDSAGIDQAHAMLHSWSAIRDLREVVPSQFLLLLEAERTVVGRNHLQVITFQSV